MPCDLDHEHDPWPTEGEFELVIEACETQCGWCSYRTKHANNLRVVSRIKTQVSSVFVLEAD
jgi:hypothetical protein